MLEPEIILGIIDKQIKNNAIFGDLLSPEDLISLINKSLIRTAEVGQILCQQGQYNDTLFLVIEGEVEISAESDGKETKLATLREGELIG
jgi:CRP-like cAMP-binding protein